VACHRYVQNRVMTDPACVDANAVRKSKTKTKMTVGESAKFLAGSRYIRDLATLVIGYGMAINIVEVTWKSQLRLAFPDATSYSAFLGTFSSATGAATIAMMIAGRSIFNRYGKPTVDRPRFCAFFLVCVCRAILRSSRSCLFNLSLSLS
jgi:AAA family ATP:ADP antiporter